MFIFQENSFVFFTTVLFIYLFILFIYLFIFDYCFSAVFFVMVFFFVLLCSGCYGFKRAFFYPQAFCTLHSFSTFCSSVITTCFYQGFPGSQQFFNEACMASFYGLKYRPGPFFFFFNQAVVRKSHYLADSIYEHYRALYPILAGFEPSL